MGLNETLIEFDRQAVTWLEQCKRATKAVETLRKAVETGNLRDLEKLRQSAVQASANVVDRAEACAVLDFDTSAYLRNGDFVAELQQAATDAGVTLYERDGVIYCYPVLVRPEPDLASVRIDKKLETILRPPVLAQLLKKLQSRGAKSNSERFIETLLSAYELVRSKAGTVAGGEVPLTDIYAALTLLPGSDREYTLLDFTRDLYFLDISGVARTKKGATLGLPASTVTRERKTKLLPFVDRSGHEKIYSLIRFTPEED